MRKRDIRALRRAEDEARYIGFSPPDEQEIPWDKITPQAEQDEEQESSDD